MTLKRFCGIASWRGAAIRSIGDNFSARDGESSTTGVETTQTLRDWIRVCVVATVAPSGAEADHHQSCVPCGFSWSCAYRISLAGGCRLPFDFFVDFFFSCASGGERGRCRSVHGRTDAWQTLALEWRGQGATRPSFHIKFLIFLTIALGHPCGGPLYVPPEPARSCKDYSSAESWKCGKVH